MNLSLTEGDGRQSRLFIQKDTVQISALHWGIFTSLGKSLHPYRLQFPHPKMRTTVPTPHRSMVRIKQNHPNKVVSIAPGTWEVLIRKTVGKPRNRPPPSWEAPPLPHTPDACCARETTEAADGPHTTLPPAKQHVFTATLET